MLNTDSHIRGSRCSVFLVPERVQAVKSLTLRHEPFIQMSQCCVMLIWGVSCKAVVSRDWKNVHGDKHVWYVTLTNALGEGLQDPGKELLSLTGMIRIAQLNT